MSASRTIILVLCLCAVVGCKNTPGALRMELVMERNTVGRHDPILLTACLRATDGPVCLGKSLEVDAELLNTGSGRMWKSYPRAYCGTGVALSLPLFPALFGIAALDLFDGLNRYDVLSRGEYREHRIVMLPQEDNWVWVEVDRIAFRAKPRESGLPLGRYRLRLTLSGTIDPRYVMNFYPTPLLWNVYDKPITGEVHFVVEGSNDVD